MNAPLLKNVCLMGAVITLLAGVASGQNQPAAKENESAKVISGRVSTSDNQPLTNARVMVGRAMTNQIQTQNVSVDKDGAFQTRPLEPGLYFVSPYAPGLIRDPSAPATSSYFRPGDTVNFKMIKGGVITGSVKNANGDGLVAIPVRAIRIRTQNGDPIPFVGSSREMMTDDRGTYRLYGLPAGTYIVSAGGQARPFGVGPTAYEGYAPTYAPSATRDTAMEIQVTNGSESPADIQFREESGHAISGTVAGAATSQGPQQWNANIVVFDVRNRADVATASAFSASSFSFAVYGVPDGEYELYASQSSEIGDQMTSQPVRIKIQGADVTGVRLTVAPLASIEGKVIFESDQKAPCGKHRASAAVETMINGRRYEPRTTSKETPPSDVPATARNTSRSGIVDGRGIFSIKNMPPGTYQIEPNATASGWYVRSVAIDRNAAANIPRDGVALKRGDHVTGLTVTFAEGAAKLSGHLSAAEGQSLPLKLRVYLVPEDRVSAGNLYRFYETAAEKDGTFTIDNVAPGRYWIVARRAEENETGLTRLMRLDETLRATVLKEAEALKKAVAFKACEQVADFDLPYLSPR
jgi:hypothetical protein